MRYEVKKLLNIWIEHGKIIVGVDFDDTIFPLNQDTFIVDRATLIQNELRALREHICLCLYTVADPQSLIYKKHIMSLYNLTPDYVNKSPVDGQWAASKPYFNLLLDDKAGLNEALEILTEFRKEMEKR